MSREFPTVAEVRPSEPRPSLPPPPQPPAPQPRTERDSSVSPADAGNSAITQSIIYSSQTPPRSPSTLQSMYGNAAIVRMGERERREDTRAASRPEVIESQAALVSPADEGTATTTAPLSPEPREEHPRTQAAPGGRRTTDRPQLFAAQSPPSDTGQPFEPAMTSGASTMRPRRTETPASGDLSSRERASAAAQPGVSVRGRSDGPIVLEPERPPEALAQPQVAPTPPAPQRIAPPPPSQEVDRDALDQSHRATARQVLPADVAQAADSQDATATEPQPASAGAAPATEPARGAAPARARDARAAAPGRNGKRTAASPQAAARETSDAQGAAAASPSAPADGAAAGATPAPQPEAGALRGQLPDRSLTNEEVIAVWSTERTPADDRAETQRMLAALRAEADQRKAAVLAAVEEQKGVIASEAQAQAGVVQASVAQRTAQIHSFFAGLRATLTNYSQQQRALVATQIEADSARARAESAARIADAGTQLSQRRTDLSAYAESERQQPQVIAREESDRADREIEAAAVETERIGSTEAARYPGDESPNPDKRAAVYDLTRRTAADIREKKPAIAQDLRSRADGFSGRYLEYAQTVNSKIEETRFSVSAELESAAERAVAAIESGRDATVQGISDRLAADLAALAGAEEHAVGTISAAGQTAAARITHASEQASGELDAAGAAIVARIDSAVDEANAAVSGVATPYMPGIIDVIDAARASITDIASSGLQQISGSSGSARESLAEAASSFNQQAGELFNSAAESANQLAERSKSAIQTVTQSRSQQAQSIVESLGTQQQELTGQVLAEIDRAISEARSQIHGINERFRSEIYQAANESIAEAKKPLTDPFWERARAAARKVGNILLGILEAIGDILAGLVILVVVALVVAAIAAAFGVILTAWTAIMIAGAILLVAGFFLALYSRSRQRELAGASTGRLVLLALGDVTGVNALIEGFTGRDIVTRQTLSDTEQTRRGITGAFSIVMLVLGARAAIKGPPGGAFVRPVEGVVRGWVGWRNAPLEAWRGIRSAGQEMIVGARQGFRELNDWLRRRFKPETIEPPAPPEEHVVPRPQDAVNSFEALEAKHRIQRATVEAMERSGIAPEVFDGLITRGISPEGAALIAEAYGLDGVRALDSLVQHGITENNAIGIIEQPNYRASADIINGLREQNVNVRSAMQVEQTARQINALDAVQRLVNSRNLGNPDSLRTFLNEIQSEFGRGQQGKLLQLQDAAQRAASGSRVFIESMPNPADPQQPYGADVIDVTRREAVQFKVVTGESGRGENPVVQNIRSAIQQLTGVRGETPPPGFRRIADVRLTNQANDWFNLSRQQILNELARVPWGDLLSGFEEIRITNGTGTHVFTPRDIIGHPVTPVPTPSRREEGNE